MTSAALCLIALLSAPPTLKSRSNEIILDRPARQPQTVLVASRSILMDKPAPAPKPARPLWPIIMDKPAPPKASAPKQAASAAPIVKPAGRWVRACDQRTGQCAVVWESWE